MAPKKHKIQVYVPKELKLTAAEKAKLKKVYRTGVAQVLKARKDRDPSPLSESNVGIAGGLTPRKKKKKVSASKKK